MDTELSALEERVRQLIALCASLREDNSSLKEQLLASGRANKQLSSQMAEAAERLDRLLARLPEDGQ